MTTTAIRTAPDDTLRSVVPEASLLGLINVLLRRRRLVVAPAVLAFVAVATFTLTRHRTYTATAAFVPQTRSPTAALQGLTSQLGLAGATGDPMQSPQFYVQLLDSREILRQVAVSPYDVGNRQATRTLAELYELRDSTPEQRSDEIIRELRNQISATAEQSIGIVRVSVTTPYDELSPQIAARILELVNAFNLQTRQSQARAERRFVEQRLGEVRTELRNAESRLQQFLQRNRDFGTSSTLKIESERLERDMLTQRTLYTELAQNFERARIEEVRDTPVITVLEHPVVPVRPDPRGLLRNCALALLLGTMMGIALAFLGEYLARLRESDSTEYEQFTRLRHDCVFGLMRPWLLLTRLTRRPPR